MTGYYNKAAWKNYKAAKDKGFPYSGSAAFNLHDYDQRSRADINGTWPFLAYWGALEIIHEGEDRELSKKLSKRLPEILANCKEKSAVEKERIRKYAPTPDTYKGYALNWEPFRIDDERYNDPGYGHFTEICELPFRATKEDKEALKELIYIPFVDPYGDGRDCTGAVFTGWVSIYTTAEKTVILHRKEMDV